MNRYPRNLEDIYNAYTGVVKSAGSNAFDNPRRFSPKPAPTPQPKPLSQPTTRPTARPTAQPAAVPAAKPTYVAMMGPRASELLPARTRHDYVDADGRLTQYPNYPGMRFKDPNAPGGQYTPLGLNTNLYVNENYDKYRPGLADTSPQPVPRSYYGAQGVNPNSMLRNLSLPPTVMYPTWM